MMLILVLFYTGIDHFVSKGTHYIW